MSDSRQALMNRRAAAWHRPGAAARASSRGATLLLLVALVAVLGAGLVAQAGTLAAGKDRHRRDGGRDGRVGAAALDCGGRRTPYANEVMLFDRSNYGGLCEIFTASDANLQDNLIGGNVASSIKVGGAVQVRLHSATGYRGTYSGVYTRNTSDFGSSGVRSNQADSILIGPRCRLDTAPASNQVKVYGASNYGDYCETFTRSDPYLANNILATWASSLKVGTGVIVELCTEDGYGGRCVTYVRNDANLGSTGDIDHDKARSIRVTPR